jgi:hypothetical protein
MGDSSLKFNEIALNDGRPNPQSTRWRSPVLTRSLMMTIKWGLKVWFVTIDRQTKAEYPRALGVVT